jgi:hypothetical protein
MATPPPAVDAGAQGYVDYVGASTSHLVIDVDPLGVVPSGMDEYLVRDRAQIEHAPKDSGSSDA